MMTRAAFHLRRFLASSMLAILLFSGLFGFTLSQVNAASAPNILNYQGRLLNANGVPISAASASMTFALYTVLATGSPGDAECVWTNSSSSGFSATTRTVTLTDGLFSENLGDTAAGTPYAAITDSIFSNNANLYLEITINGEMLTPRKQIVSAPYAMNSDTLDGFDSTQAGGTTAATLVLNSSGNLQLTGNPSGSTISSGSLYINPATGDVAANDVLFGIAVTGTTKFSLDAEGDTIATGDLAVNGGDFTTSATTFNLLTTTATTLSFASAATTLNINNAAGVSTKTINIGGTSADSPNAINIATEGTQADTIIIGNNNASTLMTLTGGNDWSIDNAGIITTTGNITTAGDVAVNGGGITSTDTLDISSSSSNISLSASGSGSGMVYVTAGDNFAVGGITDAVPFSVTEATNSVRIGDGASDSNDPAIRFFASDASDDGTLKYADTDAFEFFGGDLVHTAIATTTFGQHFVNDSITSGVGMSISRADGVTDFTGALLSIAQNDTSTTSTGNALVVVQDANNTSCVAGPCAKGLFIAQAHTTAHIADDPGGSALAIDIGEAGSTDDAIVLRAGPATTFRVTTEGNAYADGAFTGGGADLAEYFPTSNTSLGSGQIVCQDTVNKNQVTQCINSQYAPIGVVSDNPAFIGNLIGDASEDLRHNPNYSLVGLLGQIDTLVDDSRGVINIGDPITASSATSGYGAKAIGAGRIVGYALEPLSSTTGTIRVLVQPQWFGGTVAAPAPATSAEVVAANPVVIADNSVSGLTNTSVLDVDGSLNMNGGRILSVSSLQGLGGNWHLAENGDFTTHGQFIGLVNGYSGAPVETYATMSRQHLIQLSGTATLQNGIAHVLFVDVDPQFADVISNTSPYRVIATPSGLTGQIYISERTLTGFTIRDINNSNGVEVDWLVMAYNKDFSPDSVITVPVVEPVIGNAPPASAPSVEPSADTTAPLTEPAIIDPQVDALVVAEDPVITTEPVITPDPVADAPVIAEPVSTPDPAVTESSQSSALAANPTSELSSPEPVAEAAPVVEPSPANPPPAMGE